MNKIICFLVVFSIISVPFSFSETDYFIPENEGGGIFMKWDREWYEGKSLTDSGISSLFGALYALITNQFINGYEYIAIKEDDNSGQEYTYSFIRINKNPEYTIYFHLLNNKRSRSYIITFVNEFPEIGNADIYYLIHEINIADICGEIAWILVTSAE
jgi:hypothetical protein